ncbi:uncharacterized protein EDB93DRAFT_1182829 [Suillus bovinus]|uniref:uncharacterized protein n=1 Tax=Suillus bovinus TaxID=48563 RepID=UPI001B85BDD2|nr:uncharacterized protein EDB93DRAFT_1182829 [Suillus bovinus]KAG2129210.1 hypothetical protein EDB93DRAFT_1182829 [Suillus bovinus]
MIDRFFSVPVDYAKRDGPHCGPHIRMFLPNLQVIPLDEAKGSGTGAAESNLPHLLYLQGSSGFAVDLSYSVDFGNAEQASQKKTLWLDPPGTDLSMSITADISETR